MNDLAKYKLYKLPNLVSQSNIWLLRRAAVIYTPDVVIRLKRAYESWNKDNVAPIF